MAEAHEKTQAPTARKRAEARQRGQVARSADLVSAAVVLTAIALMQVTGLRLVNALREFTSQTLFHPSGGVTMADVFSVVAAIGRALAMLLIGVMVVGVVGNLLQFGFLFRLPGNEDALDMAKGWARITSPKSRVRMIADLLKLTVVALLGWSLLKQCADRIVTLQQLEVLPSFAVGMSLVFGIAMRLGVLLLTLGVLDYAYQRWQHERDLRMTPREVKDELRQMEGNPETKRNRREFSNAIVSSRLERTVATANVLIIYENQLAVAIRYDGAAASVPQVVAKGDGASAASLRNAAAVAGVAIVEREPLARTLSKLIDVGGEIPASMYAAVAEVLAFANAAKQLGGER